MGSAARLLRVVATAQHTGEFNSARILDEVWMFGMPMHNPVVMRNKIRVMQMQGSSYIKGLEGLRISPSEGLEVKRRGAEVRISRARWRRRRPAACRGAGQGEGQSGGHASRLPFPRFWAGPHSCREARLHWTLYNK